MFDVVVIGGSFAGLSAAMQLGRARRSVLVIDDGQPRNRFAEHSHGFLGQDGRPPFEILRSAREQLAKYKNVEFRSARAESVVVGDRSFTLEAQGSVSTRRLLLTYGMRDRLPPVEGLAEQWGRGVFHCPYCHGYEVGDRPLGILGNGDIAVHQSLLLPDWSSDVVLFTNGPARFDAEARTRIERRGVRIEEEPVARFASHQGTLKGVELVSGRLISRNAILIATRIEPAADLHRQLGTTMSDSPIGAFVQVDEMKQTSVSGVFAAGDLARAAGNVALAVGDGAWAGAACHRSLLAEDWG